MKEITKSNSTIQGNSLYSIISTHNTHTHIWPYDTSQHTTFCAVLNTSDQHLYCLFLHLLLFFILSQPLFFPSFIPSLISFNIHFSVRLFFVFFCFHFSLLHLFFLPLLLHHLFLFLFLFLSTTTSFLSPLPPSPLTPQPPPLSLSPSPLTPEPPLPFLLLHLFLPPSPYSSPCHHGRSKAEKT